MQTAPGSQPQPQPQPWKSTVAGVLTMVIGVIDALAFFGTVVAIILFNNSTRFMDYINDQIYPLTTGWFSAMLIFAAVVFAVVAVLAILGGIEALQRKHWGLALAGAIASIFGPWWPVGITGTVFMALARDEFKS